MPSENFWEFIAEHKKSDTSKLLLKYKKEFLDFDLSKAIIQIESRRKYAAKLTDFIANPLFLFPDSLSGEQASHQAVAKYHASLTTGCKSALDMTSGLGIDVFSLALSNPDIDTTALEINSDKAEALIHNASALGVSNIRVVNDNSVDFLKKQLENSYFRKYDLIFIDPSRRSNDNKRLYNLRVCLPDVCEIQNLLFKASHKIMIKASPMLDISQTIRDIKNISKIYVIGVKGEVKEVLIEINPALSNIETPSVFIHAVNLDNEGNIINDFISDSIFKTYLGEHVDKTDLIPGVYILEPSAMIMKTAPWNEIAERFKAKKFGGSSHIFITKEFPQDFPGRVTILDKVITKEDRKNLAGFPASVVSRNHPLSPDEIRRSLKLREGDDFFIYASRILEKPVLMLTRALKP